MKSNNPWRNWTDEELAADAEQKRQAIAKGYCRPDNRLDLWLNEVEAEITRREQAA